MHAVPDADLAHDLAGVPLTVVFADGEAIARVRADGGGELSLVPPFHVSDDDAYLVLPDDVGLELVDMFKDGDLDLLADAMRDGILAIGVIERGPKETGKKREVVLHVDEAQSAAEVLGRMPFAARVGFGRGVDPVALLNALPQAKITVASALADDVGVEKMLRRPEFAGALWTPPRGKKELAGVDPTYAWTKRGEAGQVGIEMALFVEYEELVAVLRPALLVATLEPTLSPASV